MSERKLLTYVELDIDFCAHSYGVSPCTASIGVTGDRKCFNTFKTCQDQANFLNEPKTLRFAESTEYLPGDIDAIPSIKTGGIDFTAQVINPGVDLGERASLTISFEDHQDSDTLTDPYYAERDYDPFHQGTFWGKFRARSPYIIARPLRWITGFLGQTLEEMETRHYIVESTEGPDTSGVYKIIAKDLLKIADGDRAQAPGKSTGVLLSSLAAGATSATLDPSGVGDIEYPTEGICSIGEEMMTFTRSGDVLTLSRGQYTTEDKNHESGDLVQVALVYDAETGDGIISDLLLTYALADPDWIPIDEWAYELSLYVNRVYSAVIASPTAVSDLINELIEQIGLVMYTDDIAKKIKLRSLRPVSATAQVLNDDKLLASSLKITEQPDKRVSEVWTSYSQLNPLEDLSRESNYSSGVLSIDAQSEIDNGQPAIKKVFSRWIAQFARSTATRLGAQILSRYRNPPRQMAFSVDRFDEPLQLGSGYFLQSWPLQLDTGAPDQVPVIITSLTPDQDVFQAIGEEMIFYAQDGLEDSKLIVIDQNSFNVNIRTVFDHIYLEPVDGDEVIVVIENGVVIGSLVSSEVSLNLGDWPDGVDITIKNHGSVIGAGGKGGTYKVGTSSAALYAGDDGGLAFYARRAVTIDNIDGFIAGGGGGGGGAIHSNISFIGGGGGAGSVPGPHGDSSRGQMDENYRLGTAATTTTPGTGGFGSGELSGSNNDFTCEPGNGGVLAAAGTLGRSRYQHNGATIWSGNGGLAGKAVDGDSFVTWTNLGTITGARIN